MRREQIEAAVRKQLSYELNCAPEDFLKEETVITLPVLHEKRRMFSDKPYFLQVVTFGKNAVISADESIHPWLRDWVRGRKGFWLFEQQNFYQLEKKLREYGYRMAPTHHMFLPSPEYLDIKTDLKVNWLEQKDIGAYYGREEFPNALCDRFHPERPDVLAVTALDGDKIMGMAGCSADSPDMWQIGIDVSPEYRGKESRKHLWDCFGTKPSEGERSRIMVRVFPIFRPGRLHWPAALSPHGLKRRALSVRRSSDE